MFKAHFIYTNGSFRDIVVNHCIVLGLFEAALVGCYGELTLVTV